MANSINDVLTDDSLKLFLESMVEFDRAFVNRIAEGGHFTIKLEVHGNRGGLIHARVTNDATRKPSPPR